MKEGVRQTLKLLRIQTFMAYLKLKTKDIKSVQLFDSTIIVSPPSKSNHRYFFAYGDESRDIEERPMHKRGRL